MKNFSKEDIIKLVQEKNVRFIRLQFTDILGRLKNVSITDKQLSKALDGECMFDGSSIEGFVRIEESDMYLRPDLNTFEVFPWRPQQGSVARLICDVYMPDGTPFEGDPRYILKKVLKEADALGFNYKVGPECEFFLFQTDNNGSPTTITHDEAGYFDLAPIDLGENARRDISLALEDMGFEIEASHHEVAKGQHEIDFKYGPALSTADNICTFKMVVKIIAQRHGLHATFMPKPLFGVHGSGMHTNMSLFKNGENAFYDKDDSFGLSKTAYNFMAGLLNHAKGITAITNPLINSYKRLVPGYEAPIHIAWSSKNRSPLIRIPDSKGSGSGTRLEMRSPDPSCNPYLTLAVTLAAGLDGIKNNLMPPENVDSNMFSMTEEERKKLGIRKLPSTLQEAIFELKKDQILKSALGNHIFDRYIEAKTKEIQTFNAMVHPWEVDNYLSIY